MDGSSSDILVEAVKQPRQVWKCRGLGNLCTGKELGELVRVKDKDPSVIFIAETWIDKARLDWIQHYINFEHKRVVERSN